MLKFFAVATTALTTVSPALAQTVTEQPEDEIVVIGSRTAPRTVFDSLAPVDVVSAGSLQRTASDEVLDSLAQLVPSFNVQRLPLADGLIFVRPATLRGLSPDQTLVLVNGKRRHRSALLGRNGAQSADLAQIPGYAIERIEVLRDGASAQYGSDAIAGVINIILDDDDGYAAFAQYGQYYEGDGEQARGGVRGGWSNDLGFLNLTFELSDSEPTSRSRQRLDAIVFQENNPDLNVPNPAQNWGQPERQAYRFAFNSALKLREGEAYFFGTYGWGEGVSDFNWRNPATTSAFNTTDVFPGFDLRDTYPVGFAPQFGQEDEDLSAVVGYEGVLNGLDGLSYDFSVGFGRNEIDYFINNTINASLGPDSPTSFDPGTLIQRELNFNADFNYEWPVDGLVSPVNIAFGAERREETYEIEAGDDASFAIGPGAAAGLPSGSNGFPGYSQAQAGEFDQESYAGYIDIEIPFTEKFTLGLAGRYEDFSEFGDTLNGKISARYEVTPSFALRATASTGFRAPTPGQLFSERTSQGLDTVTLNIFTAGRFSPQGLVADVISQRDDVVIAPLDAEESENFSAGFTFRQGGFVGSVDAYHVRIDNRFGSSPNFNPTDEERAAFVSLGVPGGEGITRVSFFQNDFDTETTGVDVVGSYDTDLGWAKLKLTGAYNFNETEVTGGGLADNDVGRVRFEEQLPKHSANASALLERGPFSGFVRTRYSGSWTDFSFNAEGDIFQEFGGEVFVDAFVAVEITDGVSLRFGGENIFDNFPEEAEFQANRGLIYSRNAPYDTDGGFWYLRLDANF